MFGTRKKIQAKSVEDYLKGEDARVPSPEPKPAAGPAIPAKARPFIAQGVITLFILALMLVAFSQLSSLRSQVAELRAGKEGEARVLKTYVAEIAAKLEKSTRQVDSLSDTVSTLQRELDAEKSSRTKAEAALAATRAAVPDKTKKATKPAHQ
jgi:hypothetical protein